MMKHSRFSSHSKKYCSWLVLRSSFHPDQGTHQVSDESLGRDETSFVRLTMNNVFSQVTVNFIVNVSKVLVLNAQQAKSFIL